MTLDQHAMELIKQHAPIAKMGGMSNVQFKRAQAILTICRSVDIFIARKLEIPKHYYDIPKVKEYIDSREYVYEPKTPEVINQYAYSVWVDWRSEMRLLANEITESDQRKNKVVAMLTYRQQIREMQKSHLLFSGRSANQKDAA